MALIIKLLIVSIFGLPSMAAFDFTKSPNNKGDCHFENLTISCPDLKLKPQVKAQVKAYEDRFFSFLHPYVTSANQEIAKERAQLLALKGKLALGKHLDVADQEWLNRLAIRYRVDNFSLHNKQAWDKLIHKVDIIPVALALAQAANESAFGKSRFARQANNLFGIWCYSPGCGVVPKQRARNAVHEVRRFDSVQACVVSYMQTLNSHQAYEKIRHIRSKLRSNGSTVSASALAEGLEKYAALGKRYVYDIRQMIKRFNLEDRYGSLAG